jgi:hypothetical protein
MDLVISGGELENPQNIRGKKYSLGIRTRRLLNVVTYCFKVNAIGTDEIVTENQMKQVEAHLVNT